MFSGLSFFAFPFDVPTFHPTGSAPPTAQDASHWCGARAWLSYIILFFPSPYIKLRFILIRVVKFFFSGILILHLFIFTGIQNPNRKPPPNPNIFFVPFLNPNPNVSFPHNVSTCTQTNGSCLSFSLVPGQSSPCLRNPRELVGTTKLSWVLADQSCQPPPKPSGVFVLGHQQNTCTASGCYEFFDLFSALMFCIAFRPLKLKPHLFLFPTSVAEPHKLAQHQPAVVLIPMVQGPWDPPSLEKIQ